MRHLSAALGSSSGFLIGMPAGDAGVDIALPRLNRQWPRLHPRADAATGVQDSSVVVDLDSPAAWGGHPVPVLTHVRADTKHRRT